MKKSSPPTVSDLLVEQVREVERLRALMIANECKTIEEFREIFSKTVELY